MASSYNFSIPHTVGDKVSRRILALSCKSAAHELADREQTDPRAAACRRTAEKGCFLRFPIGRESTRVWLNDGWFSAGGPTYQDGTKDGVWVFRHGLAHDRISVRTGYETSTRTGRVAGRETGEASLENGSFGPDLGQIWQGHRAQFHYLHVRPNMPHDGPFKLTIVNRY